MTRTRVPPADRDPLSRPGRRVRTDPTVDPRTAAPAADVQTCPAR